MGHADEDILQCEGCIILGSKHTPFVASNYNVSKVIFFACEAKEKLQRGSAPSVRLSAAVGQILLTCLFPKPSVKIDWHEPKETPTSSAT